MPMLNHRFFRKKLKYSGMIVIVIGFYLFLAKLVFKFKTGEWKTLFKIFSLHNKTYLSFNENLKPMPQKFVILSSNLKPRYLFILPFVVASWKKLNVEVIVVLIGERDEYLEDKQSYETVKFLEELNTFILYLMPKRISYLSFSQLIRLFAAVLPLPSHGPDNETILITSDADLIVFNISNHIPNIVEGKRLHLYNSQCCEPVKIPPKKGNYKVHMYPMGTIGATIETWKDLMGFNESRINNAAIEDYLFEEFGENFFHVYDDQNPELIGSFTWYADQSLISYKINEWFKQFNNRYYSSETKETPRRIDRTEWPSAKTFAHLKIQDWDDCHLLTNAHLEDQWPSFKSFLEFVFDNNNLIERFVKYREDFVNKT